MDEDYICVGGWLKDPDGLHIAVPAQEVQRQFGVSRCECRFIVDEEALEWQRQRGMILKDAIILRPDPTGVYTLPKKEESP